jgi:hypothetical protein
LGRYFPGLKAGAFAVVPLRGTAGAQGLKPGLFWPLSVSELVP